MKKKISPQIVTAAVIENNGNILIAKRRQGSRFAGKWEFPGGKLEKGETPEQCLKRELQEELEIVTDIGDLICTTDYSYTPDLTVRLLAYRTTVISGVFNLNDHEEIRWVKPADLANYDFPEADKPIVEKLINESHLENGNWGVMKTDSEMYSIDFIEEDGKTFALFYDSKGNLVAKREIPHQDITEAIRLNGENN